MLEALTLAAHQQVVLQWQRKLKDVFDPNDTGEGSYVCAVEPKDKITGTSPRSGGASKTN